MYEVSTEDVSVPDMILFLKNRLRDLPRTEALSVAPARSNPAEEPRRAMICLFLAVLEMVKQQAIRLTQTGEFRRDSSPARQRLR